MTAYHRTGSKSYFSSAMKFVALFLAMTAGILVTALLAAGQVWLSVVFAMALLVGLILLSKPDLITLIVIFIIYSNASVVAVRFHGVPLAVGAAIPLLLLVPLSIYVVLKHLKLIINKAVVFLFLYVAVKVVSAFTAPQIDIAFSDMITTATEGLVLYLLILNTVRTPKMIQWTILSLLLAGAFLGSLSIYQQVTHSFQNNYGGFAQMSNAAFGTGVQSLQGEVEQPRLAGPFGDQNYYAQIMLMLVPLGLFQFWGERSRLLRLLYAGLTSLALIGAALTFSRGAAVAFAIMLVVMFFLGYIKPYQLVFTLLCTGLLIVALPQYWERIASIETISSAVSGQSTTGIESADSSTKSRLTEMGTAGLVFADHPVLGVGPGLFKYYYPSYAEAIGIKLHSGVRAAHDLYLDIAADTGALGLICFLAVLAITLLDLSRVRKRWLSAQPEIANLSIGFILAIITYMTTGIFLSLAYERYLWLILALAGSLVHILNQMPVTTPEQSA